MHRKRLAPFLCVNVSGQEEELHLFKPFIRRGLAVIRKMRLAHWAHAQAELERRQKPKTKGWLWNWEQSAVRWPWLSCVMFSPFTWLTRLVRLVCLVFGLTLSSCCLYALCSAWFAATELLSWDALCDALITTKDGRRQISGNVDPFFHSPIWWTAKTIMHSEENAIRPLIHAPLVSVLSM